MDLLTFVRALPEGYAYTPVYQKGAELPSGGVSKGKSPFGRAHHQVMGPADVALQIERAPETFQAVGVFTGPRSQGLVILDVDANLAKLQRKWGDSLDGAPVVRSTKANAAKFLLRVPPEHWGEVKGVSLTASGAGYEVLWGRQGLLYGAYPGSSDGKAKEGLYTFTGDLGAIPEAPAWLLAEMRDAATHAEPEVKGFLKNRKALDFSDRTEDEIAEIAQDCLKVIPHLGAGSRDQWLQVGMALHDALPNELGLTLWSAWSADDPEYGEEWKDGNPCEKPWASFKRGGGIRFNSLVWMADQQDPERRRFSDVSRTTLETAEGAQVQQIRAVTLSFEELYKRADEIFADLEMSVGKRRYRLMSLAMEGGIRHKPVQELTEMYLAEREKRLGSGGVRTARERWLNPTQPSFYVPGVMCSGVWLMSGRGGCGKSQAAWSFARHFLSGSPLHSDDGNLTWEQGPVLWLSGDQPEPVLDDQIRMHLQLKDCENLYVENNFNINDYPTFILLAQKYRPKLVVIDSLRSTHRGTGVSENDSEFALPLRWYEQMMGQPGMFEPCMILVIHHSGHARGGARGTSALGDMTSFVLNFDTPSETSGFDPRSSRLITFDKHRYGRKGDQILCTRRDDETVQLRYLGPPAEEHASTVQDRIRIKMQRMPEKAWTIQQLSEDAVVCGGMEACKKAVQRLMRMGLCEKRGDTPSKGSNGRPKTLYGAIGIALNKGIKYSVSTVPESPVSVPVQRESRGTGVSPLNALSLNTGGQSSTDEPHEDAFMEGGGSSGGDASRGGSGAIDEAAARWD